MSNLNAIYAEIPFGKICYPYNKLSCKYLLFISDEDIEESIIELEHPELTKSDRDIIEAYYSKNGVSPWFCLFNHRIIDVNSSDEEPIKICGIKV